MTLDSAPAVIFLHLPKTAGTTLHRIIERQYPAAALFSTEGGAGGTQARIEAFEALPDAARAQLHMLKGHMAFGLHTKLPQGGTYFTLLREPRARLLSYIRFITAVPGHPLHDAMRDGRMDVAEFLDIGGEPLLDNGQTRLLSGVWNRVPYRHVGTKELAQAQRNLRTHFSVVGLAEQFDATLLLAQRAYGWGDVTYISQNVTPKPAGSLTLNAEAEKLIRYYNRHDDVLYATAKALFDEAIAAQGPTFAADLAAFQQRNQRLQPWRRLQGRLQRVSIRGLLRR